MKKANFKQIETNAIRYKISKASSHELVEITRKLIQQWEECPVEIFYDIKHKVLQGYQIPEELHADLVVLSRSFTLYQSRTYSAPSWIRFLQAGIPDKLIELNLAEVAMNELINRSTRYGLIKDSLMTLRHFGSTACLRFLEIAQYEIYSVNKVDKLTVSLFSDESNQVKMSDDPDSWYRRKAASINVKLVELLDKTIDVIRTRDGDYDAMWSDWSTL